MIGSLKYLASATGPVISFVVNKLSQFTSKPGNDHWHVLEWVMCYLRGTMSYEIYYLGYNGVLKRYSDSNWILDANEIYTISGYLFTLGSDVVSWR